MHHDFRLPRHPLDVHRADPIPNVPATGKLYPVLLGAVRNGNRHDFAPDKGSTIQDSQGGMTKLKERLRTEVEVLERVWVLLSI